MIWEKLKQQETFLMSRLTLRGTDLKGDLYKDHLIILGDSGSNEERLCCWNISISSFRTGSLLVLIDTNSWSTFDINRTGISQGQAI